MTNVVRGYEGVSVRLAKYIYIVNRPSPSHLPLLSGAAVLHTNSEVSQSKVPRLPPLTLLNDNLMNANQNSHLNKPLKRNSLQPRQTIRQIRELQISARRQKTVEAVKLSGDDAEEGRHGNAPVFHFDAAVVGEVFFGSSVGTILDQAQRIEVTCERAVSEAMSEVSLVLEFCMS